MFIVSWYESGVTRSKGHRSERDADRHEWYLRKLGLNSVVVWELPEAVEA